MNALTIPAAARAAAPVALPPLPAPVAHVVSHLLVHRDAKARRAAADPAERDRIHVGALPSPPIPTAEEQRQARAHLAAMQPFLAPATAEDWAEFLRPVVRACRVPMSRDDYHKKVAAIAGFCSDIPRAALTPAALASMKFEFFPGPETIRDAVEQEAQHLRASASVLEEVVSGPTTAHPLWHAVGGRLLPAEFRRWIGPLGLVREEEERRAMSGGGFKTLRAFTLSAPLRFHADHVRREYGHILSQGLGGRVDFEVVAAGAGH